MHSPGRHTGLRALLVAAGLTHAVVAAASGPVPNPPPPAVAQPHLESPSIPEPRQLHTLLPATSQLLWASGEIQVTGPIRLIVFAPHPDDETLAAGGLIQRVLARGGQVRIVFVTNGDGYVDGVRKEVQRTHTLSSDFIHYGERRHQEALRAIHALGLPPESALFLGFPDDGIDDLWQRHWSAHNPYTSPHTHLNRPVYKASLSQRVEYAGVELRGEIARVLRDFSPDWVLVPDPRDRHPDHCTTGVFVLEALRRLQPSKDSRSPRPHVLAFLVHYPNYPASPVWMKEIAGAGVGGSPAAGRVLAEARWTHLQLTPAESAAKGQALSAYQSQVHVMNPFLKQFMLPFELFAELDAAQIDAVPGEYAARFPGRR
ncbi:MAG: PIG-L family deacetylase [Candidatus Binatia bacterium]